MKHLYRSEKNKIFTGLLGGIGEYFNIDPVIVRLIFIFVALFTHVVPMLIVYLIGYVVVPLPPDIEVVSDSDAS